jgi:nucleotide-binding universal stress UspA family protein
MYRHLLVPIDGSRLSEKAVVHALELAKRLGAKITVFYASPEYPLPVYTDGVVYDPVSKKEYAKWPMRKAEDLDGALKKAKAAGVDCDCLRDRRRTREAIQGREEGQVRRNRDGVAWAAQPRGLLLGNETQKVLTHSKLPVPSCADRRRSCASAEAVRYNAVFVRKTASCASRNSTSRR